MASIEVNVDVKLSGEDVAKALNEEEIASFCSQLAERLDGDFVARKKAASAFADGLSETGCRFLAEVIASHFMRNKT